MISKYSRFKTRVVNIGGIPVGGDNPIRIQSMTNTPISDIKLTVEQCIRIFEAGADYVRLAVPSIKDIENLSQIKKTLRSEGYNFPLIADVHFNPDIAELAAEIVEKVRINPGNFGVKSRSYQSDSSESSYEEELALVRIKLKKLIEICKKNGTAIRIGVNHGSLSQRIMNKYGDTPEGMIESAIEFIRLCEEENFHNLVISLKSSNTRVMVYAYRLLVKKMISLNYHYPIHLGVTEAGEGEDGRIKSCVGIGALLLNGIGDTIRISLTEEPEKEIPVAKNLVKYFSSKFKGFGSSCNFITEYKKRFTIGVQNIGGKGYPIVISDYVDNCSSINIKPDYYYLSATKVLPKIDDDSRYILNLHDWYLLARDKKNIYPLYTAAEFDFYGTKNDNLNFVILSYEDLKNTIIESLRKTLNTVIIIETFKQDGAIEQREVIKLLSDSGINLPVILNRNYCEDDKDVFIIKSSVDTGNFFIDGLADGIFLRNSGNISHETIINISYGILQACRVRQTKTEYLSCPSCGRTLFDIQKVVETIRKRTGHLKNLKIAVMGCIVNGPGEMADADYGYVGSGINKVNLYKGRTLIKTNISSEMAVDELISLIKENNDWVEP